MYKPGLFVNLKLPFKTSRGLRRSGDEKQVLGDIEVSTEGNLSSFLGSVGGIGVTVSDDIAQPLRWETDFVHDAKESR